MRGALLAVLLFTSVSEAQPAFDLDWTSTTRVIIVGGDLHGPERDTTGERHGNATLTLATGRLPGTTYEFDFTGPEGGGSGFVLDDRRATLDANFAFPADPVPELPGGMRRVTGHLHVHGASNRPTGLDLRFDEVFICGSAPVTCGGVVRWERSFRGTGRPIP